MTRLRSISLFAAGLAMLALAAAAADGPSPPAAAQQNSPALYVTREQLAQKLQSAIAAASDPALSPIGVSEYYSIHEVNRKKSGDPAVHAGWTELHFILEGSATFVTGGTLIPAVGGAKSIIQGGVSRQVRKGDAILVPSNTPHWYKQVDESLTYLEVRFANPTRAEGAQ